MEENHVCSICGKEATKYHMSIIGCYKYYVCDEHYKITSSTFGWCDERKMNRMGLTINMKFVDMPYYK